MYLFFKWEPTANKFNDTFNIYFLLDFKETVEKNLFKRRMMKTMYITE